MSWVNQVHWTKSLLLAIAILSAGCERHVHTESRTLSEGISYEDAERQERFKQALSTAGVPFKVVARERGQEFVEWEAQYSSEVERVQDSIFVPPGRSIRFDMKTQSRFKEWLEHNGIPYRTLTEKDGEWVVWEQADAERVRAWKEFPAHYGNAEASPH
jgi:hypothetical protein